jgi:hypothetical protein
MVSHRLKLPVHPMNAAKSRDLWIPAAALWNYTRTLRISRADAARLPLCIAVNGVFSVMAKDARNGNLQQNTSRWNCVTRSMSISPVQGSNSAQRYQLLAALRYDTQELCSSNTSSVRGDYEQHQTDNFLQHRRKCILVSSNFSLWDYTCISKNLLPTIARIM